MLQKSSSCFDNFSGYQNFRCTCKVGDTGNLSLTMECQVQRTRNKSLTLRPNCRLCTQTSEIQVTTVSSLVPRPRGEKRVYTVSSQNNYIFFTVYNRVYINKGILFPLTYKGVKLNMIKVRLSMNSNLWTNLIQQIAKVLQQEADYAKTQLTTKPVLAT